ncbi:MAG TPA: hypothetical protein VFI33_19895, partial [Puia sp.]|nr:hypothetical protein [Puia sp.]
SEQYSRQSGVMLPLPRFIFRPLTSAIIAIVHIYLASGHLYHVFTGDFQFTDVWKGFGALLGAYVFAALAFNGYASRSEKFAGKKLYFKNQDPV